MNTSSAKTPPTPSALSMKAPHPPVPRKHLLSSPTSMDAVHSPHQCELSLGHVDGTRAVAATRRYTLDLRDPPASRCRCRFSYCRCYHWWTSGTDMPSDGRINIQDDGVVPEVSTEVRGQHRLSETNDAFAVGLGADGALDGPPPTRAVADRHPGAGERIPALANLPMTAAQLASTRRYIPHTHLPSHRRPHRDQRAYETERGELGAITRHVVHDRG